MEPEKPGPPADKSPVGDIVDTDALDAKLAETLAKMTPTQRSRVLAHLGGETKSEIARREGVSPAAITQALQSGVAREAFCIAGHRYISTFQRTKDSEPISLVPALFDNLFAIATGATRPASSGGHGRYTMVPDHRLRYEATLKLIELVEPANSMHGGANASPSAGGGAESGEVVARERTTVSRTREIRRRA